MKTVLKDSRPKQTNCQQEPTYPDHQTVVFSIRYPDMTCHLRTDLCPTEHPHLIEECEEFSAIHLETEN